MKSDEFRQRLEDEKIEGWKVKTDGDEKVIMYKPNYGSLGGHILIALLTVWWTLGLGNILYASYKYFRDSPQKMVRNQSVENA